MRDLNVVNHEEFLENFLKEVIENIEDIEIETLKIESKVTKESLHRIYKKFHTVKGISGFMGFKSINFLSHEAGELVAKCRLEEIDIDSDLLECLFKMTEYIRGICENPMLESDDFFQKDIENFLITVERSEEKKIGAILLNQNSINKEDLDYVLKRQRELNYDIKFGELAVKEKIIKGKEIALALRKQSRMVFNLKKGFVERMLERFVK